MESISPYLSSLAWLIGSLILLVVFQRRLHYELQYLLLLLTRRPDVSLVLFSLLFFPGVLLHEISHYLTARLLGVRTGRLSLLPRRLPGGKLQLGYVETSQADWLRETIIGSAPLVSGTLFVAYAGFVQLQLSSIWSQVTDFDLQKLWLGLQQAGSQPDSWLWFYLVLTVSSMMFPSAADRRWWLPVGLGSGLLLSLSIFLGAGPWMAHHLAPAMALFIQAMAGIFTISTLAHLLLFLPCYLLHVLLGWLLGVNAA